MYTWDEPGDLTKPIRHATEETIDWHFQINVHDALNGFGPAQLYAPGEEKRWHWQMFNEVKRDWELIRNDMWDEDVQAEIEERKADEERYMKQLENDKKAEERKLRRERLQAEMEEMDVIGLAALNIDI